LLKLVIMVAESKGNPKTAGLRVPVKPRSSHGRAGGQLSVVTVAQSEHDRMGNSKNTFVPTSVYSE
jgi:hypothetical protein